jgi:hypothetical protein
MFRLSPVLSAIQGLDEKGSHLPEVDKMLRPTLPQITNPNDYYAITALYKGEPWVALERGMHITLPTWGIILLQPLTWTAIDHELGLQYGETIKEPSHASVLLISPDDVNRPAERGLLVETRVLRVPGRVVTLAFNLLPDKIVIRKGEHISRLVCL